MQDLRPASRRHELVFGARDDVSIDDDLVGGAARALHDPASGVRPHLGAGFPVGGFKTVPWDLAFPKPPDEDGVRPHLAGVVLGAFDRKLPVAFRGELENAE